MSAEMIQRISLSVDETDLVIEFLRLGSQSLDDLLQEWHRKMPDSAFCEALRRWIEEAADLRERIQAFQLAADS